jgi:iron(III) transport system ATP-binding protein/putative spermidine/putrescine transport system ATP-binding protein/spermidine/putrescine transport system ATP-binding protein
MKVLLIDSSTTKVIEGTVRMSTYLGSTVRYDIQVGGISIDWLDTILESTGAKIFERRR